MLESPLLDFPPSSVLDHQGLPNEHSQLTETQGKSTFLSKITKTKSEVAAYSFTTLTAIPGVLEYGGAEIQVLDLPGIIEGASEGKGRGRQVISAAKVSADLVHFHFQWLKICQTSDLILMILDATKRIEQRALLEAELEAVGIRLNREPP